MKFKTTVSDPLLAKLLPFFKEVAINESLICFYQQAMGYVLLKEPEALELKNTYMKHLKECNGDNIPVHISFDSDYEYGFNWFDETTLNCVMERYPEFNLVKLIKYCSIYFYENYFQKYDQTNIFEEIPKKVKEIKEQAV